MLVEGEVKLFYFISLVVLLIFLLFILLFVLLFKKRQNELLLKTQLIDEKNKNEILYQELEIKKILEKERERISMDLHDDLGASFECYWSKIKFS